MALHRCRHLQPTPSSVQTAGVKSLSSQAPCPRPTAPAWRQGATDTTSLRQTRVTLRPLPALSPHGTGAPTRAGSGHCQCEWFSLRKDTPAERSGEIGGMGDRHAALVSIPSIRKKSQRVVAPICRLTLFSLNLSW